jgi:hypothetical protein
VEVGEILANPRNPCLYHAGTKVPCGIAVLRFLLDRNNQYMQNGLESPLDIKRSMFRTAGRHAGASSWISLLAAFSLMSSPLATAAAATQPQKPATLKPASSAPVKTAQRLTVDPGFFHPTDRSFVGRYLKPGSFMSVSDIKPGMKGYGLTVFHGDKIEKFNVQIIGVVKKILNGRDAILARLSGGEMGKNCVIKGMSGSPCYINGKLIGSVSFGFDFQKEPIAGITPIVDMLDALADTNLGGGKKKDNVAHLSAPSWSIASGVGSGGVSMTSGGAPRMVPLMSPVSLCGFSPRAEQFLTKKFESMGLGVTAGASGGMNPTLSTADKKIEPGSAVSVLLADGDFSIAATGTATARFGDKVLAFGHPFMQGGSIDFPMATAYVHQVMPSLAVSFKLASPVNVVGSVNADRPWGIGGRMGHAAHMIPAAITVVDEPRHIEKTYHITVIDHPELTPELLASAATSAIDATHQTAGPYVARVESEVDADGIEPIIRTDRFATGLAPKSFLDMFMGGDPVGRYVHRVADSIMNNEFQREAIKSVKLKITIQDGHKTAKIDRVYIDKPFVAPGEEVKVTAVIKPFNQPKVEHTMKLTVPRDIPDGNMLIGIAGGSDYEYIKNRLGIVDPDPENLKQIAQHIREEARGDQISMVIGLPEQSLMINGQKLVNPPAYWTKVFFSNRHTKGPTMVKGEMKTTRDEDWMLDGSHIIAVEVRSQDKAQARIAPYPIPAPANNNEDLSITEQARKALDANPSAGKKSRGSSGGISLVLGGSSSGSTTTTTSTSSGSTSTSTSKTSTPATITASTGKEYPHVRPVQIWRQDSEEDFRSGKLDDSTVDSWGRLSPGFESTANKQVSTEDQIWSSAWANGNFYYGSADELWRWKADDSKPERIGKLDGIFIPAMVADSQGVIYATSVPSGKVYAIDTKSPGSKPQIVFTASEPIIASLAVDDKDNLYAGTASTGKIYKIDAGSHKSSVLFDSGQAHVLSMFYCKPEGTLYFGTGEKGSVYAIDKTGKPHAVYQSPDHFVTGVVKDAKGDLYVSSAGSGHLVRVAPSGEPTTLASSEAFYKLHYDAATDTVFSGDAEGDITMACVDPITKQSYFMPVCHTEQEAVLALASDGKNLYSGTSNLAVLRAFKMQLSTKPLFTSAVRDASRSAQWSRMHIMGPFNELSSDLLNKVRVETRTGETSKPDETWSAWKQASLRDSSFAVESPAGRYLQYRLSWNTAGDRIGAEKIDRFALGRIDTTFLPGNTAPQISSISVKSGSAVGGKQDVSVTGTDADGDNLLLTLELSSDGGNSWKPIKEDIRSKSAKKDKSDSDSDSSKDDEDKSSEKKTSTDPTGKEKTTSSSDSDTSKDSKDDKDKDDSNKSDSTDTPAPSSVFRDSNHRVNLDGTSGNKAGTGPSDDDKPAADKDKGDKDKDDKDKSSDDKSSDDKADKDKSASDKDKKTDHNKVAKKSKKKSPTHGSSTVSSSDSSSKSSSEGSSSTESFTYSWDTGKQKDGNYLVKFVVDDKLSNPSENQKVINLRSVTVDNTPPEIELIDNKRNASGKLEFKVTAKDKLTAIANATYKIDDGEPFAFSFEPNSIDGLNATLIANGVKVDAGTHKVEVKVSDRAGNTATKSITIK